MALTPSQIATCQQIIITGEAALARWSASNPMRAMVATNIAKARAKLAEAA